MNILGRVARKIPAYSRALYYKTLYGRRLRLGRGVSFHAPLSISGKIKVIFGDGVILLGALRVQGEGTLILGDRVRIGGANGPNIIDLCFVDASIRIGNDTFLNGVRLAARKEIVVGENCILGECRILDTDFHSVEVNRHDPSAVIVDRPVRLERNVWIANGAMILKGVTIGENSVAGACAVVSRDVPPNAVVAGNPARIVKHLDQPDYAAKR